VSRDNGDQKGENASQLALPCAFQKTSIFFPFFSCVMTLLGYSTHLPCVMGYLLTLASPHVEVVVLLFLGYCTVSEES
jgi:hypothetical protein